MTHALRIFGVAIIPALLVTIGCGSDASFSPTAPSATNGSRGAVITGRVTGMSTSATTATQGTFTTMAESRVTVTVVGANISSTVDGTGQFTLTGVPPGDVRLKFSGNGVDATITLSGVSASDRITITVALNGDAARVESEQREHDEDDGGDVEVEGVVSNLSGGCPTLTFTVRSTTTVKTNSSTTFEHGTCGRIANGSKIEVEGVHQADGSILAKEIEFDD